MHTIWEIVILSFIKKFGSFLVQLSLMSKASAQCNSGGHAGASQFKKPIEFNVHVKPNIAIIRFAINFKISVVIFVQKVSFICSISNLCWFEICLLLLCLLASSWNIILFLPRAFSIPLLGFLYPIISFKGFVISFTIFNLGLILFWFLFFVYLLLLQFIASFSGPHFGLFPSFSRIFCPWLNFHGLSF